MHLLFDSKSVQVQQQTQTGTRLNTLLGAIRSAGTALNDPWKVSYTTKARIKRDDLTGIGVLVVLTRDPNPGHGYNPPELDAIADYVHHGGNLLLMTSHPPHFTNDAPLAARFGVTLQPVFVSNLEVEGLAVDAMVMSGGCLNQSLADDLLDQVDALISHDSCGISAPAGAVSIATFPSSAVVSTGGPPAYKDFAVRLDHGSGRVIVVGNSGMVCDYGNPTPSCGLAPLGNNLLFFLNCIRFLIGVPAPAYSGACPGQPSPSPQTKSRGAR
jgi:hypothetical protein